MADESEHLTIGWPIRSGCCWLANQGKLSKSQMERMKGSKDIIGRMLIKCADVSNPARNIDIYTEWADRIKSEYFSQVEIIGI